MEPSLNEHPTQDYLLSLERKLIEGMEWLCRVYWQQASGIRQAKYVRFALSSEAYEAQRKLREQPSPDRFNLETLMFLVEKLLPGDLAFSYSLPQDLAGAMLKQVSFRLCSIGGAASWGDLETNIPWLAAQWMPEWNTLEPRVCLKEWRRANLKPLLELLYTMQSLALMNIKELSARRRVPFSQLGVFRVKGPTEVVVDGPYLNTEYRFYTSLLGLFEPPGGLY